MPDRYDTDYDIGQDNMKKYGMDIHHPVFWIASLLILVFVIGTLLVPESAKEAFDGAKGWSISNFDWLFMVAGNIFVIFCLMLIIMPVGKVRIGGDDARPEFSTMSWFSMLFAAGMGIGLMFYGVSEPISHFSSSVAENAGTAESWAPLAGALPRVV